MQISMKAECRRTHVPGVLRLAACESITRTQSFESGDVKLCVPVLAIVPIFVTAAVRGLYQLQLARFPVSVIFVISIVIVWFVVNLFQNRQMLVKGGI